jgi:hypothetical protein
LRCNRFRRLDLTRLKGAYRGRLNAGLTPTEFQQDSDAQKRNLGADSNCWKQIDWVHDISGDSKRGQSAIAATSLIESV